jgi:hypothetical protein
VASHIQGNSPQLFSGDGVSRRQCRLSHEYLGSFNGSLLVPSPSLSTHLTPCSRALIEELMVAQLLKNLSPLRNLKSNYRLGFEIFAAVVMKSAVLRDITPCSPLKVNRRFGGTYRLHLQGRRISRARNQVASRACYFHTTFQQHSTDGGVGRAQSV